MPETIKHHQTLQKKIHAHCKTIKGYLEKLDFLLKTKAFQNFQGGLKNVQ